jgi:hypothetical protein
MSGMRFNQQYVCVYVCVCIYWRDAIGGERECKSQIDARRRHVVAWMRDRAPILPRINKR